MGVIISWHGSRDRILEQTTDKINKSLKSPQRELFFKLWDVQFSFSCSTSCRLGSPGYSLYCSALVVLRYFLSMHVCLVTIISRICKDWRNNTVQLPLYGEVLTLSLGVAPFCTVFVILWAAYRHSSFAWIGQDILGICWMINIIQKEHLPNIRVASVLLGGAFVYDIFWVFISPLIFHESVMLAVSAILIFTFASILTISHALVLRINLHDRFSS
uniref:Uncharacterized protein n=1 Tax=Triticum urartu TaxID=4572 RepID=A0A8R7UWJ6_TRIUA